MEFDCYFELDSECSYCFENITKDNFVLYQNKERGEWYKFQYCSSCVVFIINNQWNKYVQDVEKTDCMRSLESLLEMGPPINFRDRNIENNNEIHKFYYSGSEQSAKLAGSLIGEERITWLNNKKKLLLNK